MTVQVQCPDCGKKGAVSEAMLHRKGHCPQCGTRFVFAPSTEGEKPGLAGYTVGYRVVRAYLERTGRTTAAKYMP